PNTQILAVNNQLNWITGTVTGLGTLANVGTATLTGGNKTLSVGAWNNFGTTEINLDPGSSLTVNSGSGFFNGASGTVEFQANNNAIAGAGLFGNSGTVSNTGTGTNTVSTTRINNPDGTWAASTGRLNIAPAGTSNDFFDRTTITGGEVYFTAGTITFQN